MAWFSGKVSLGNFPDLAGAVNKISESVKNIEKNFDTALGFEDKSGFTTSEASGLWPSATDTKALFDPVMAFMGHKGGESTVESIEEKPSSSVEEKDGVVIDGSANSATEQIGPAEEVNEETSRVFSDTAEGTENSIAEGTNAVIVDHVKSESVSQSTLVELSESNVEQIEEPVSLNHLNQKEPSVMLPMENPELVEAKQGTNDIDQAAGSALWRPEAQNVIKLHEIMNEQETQEEEIIEEDSPVQAKDAESGSQAGMETELPGSIYATCNETEGAEEHSIDILPAMQPPNEASGTVSESVSRDNDTIVREVDLNQPVIDYEPEIKEQLASSGSSTSEVTDSVELERLKKDMKMMETALQGAARQAQVFNFYNHFMGSVTCTQPPADTWNLNITQKFSLTGVRKFHCS
ncbi:golgin Putative 5 [Actinidia rufa]|uniref:Golgin Putative 5 n=1 Tax=Actinidia rufa TaxID=165716 RepID=A0A7J0GLT2_9ERIC|nr:golgin Putative 5 [Actinidia rufa]